MNNPNVLISSGGRRVGLLQCFRDSLRRQGHNAEVSMTDAGTSAPLAFVADRAHRVPRVTDPGYLAAVKKICVETSVRLLAPTIDTELPVYAAARASFASIGTTVSISGPETVAICGDKIATHEWLTANGFPTVRQTTPEGALTGGWRLPLIAKPRGGSASIGVRRIETSLELRAVAERTEHHGDIARTTVIQEIAEGREFTINAYVNRAGRCVCAVPHWRMETRAGEVSKGVTVKDRRLMDLARAVVEALPGAYGPMNVQCFMDESGTIRIIEINARFGGGYPLAHHAGTRFTDWLLDELDGKQVSCHDDWIDDLAMLRYDEAVFVPGSRIRT
jgi:carbamoyl-phosphate synthase large subunit